MHKNSLPILYKENLKDKMNEEEELEMKKLQIMLPLWLADFIELIANEYDLSISEVARLQICYAIIARTHIVYKDYVPEMPLKEISKEITEFLDSEDREDFLRFLSEIYFEARKAVKFRLKIDKH